MKVLNCQKKNTVSEEETIENQIFYTNLILLKKNH